MNKLLLSVAALAVAVPAMAQVQAPLAPIAPRMEAPQTRDQAVAKVREHFARMDVNRDGFVAADEMRSMRGKRMAQGVKAARDPAKAFDRLDANRDGMISRDEFGRAREMRSERRAERNAARGGVDGDRRAMRKMHRMGGRQGGGMMMRMADLDKDGRVSLQEATTSALQRFDRVDANRDGRISPDERQQNREQRKTMRGQRTG